jgi:hypothetical protein
MEDESKIYGGESDHLFDICKKSDARCLLLPVEKFSQVLTIKHEVLDSYYQVINVLCLSLYTLQIRYV